MCRRPPHPATAKRQPESHAETDKDVYEAGRRWRREIERGLSGKRRVELDAETAKAESEIDEAVRDHTARIRVDVGEASVSNVRASSAAAVVAAPLS